MTAREQIAHHEAGHAVIRAVLLGDYLPVEIFDQPVDGADGIAHGTGRAIRNRHEVYQRVLVTMAGPIAEAKYLADAGIDLDDEAWLQVMCGAEGDDYEAEALIAKMGPLDPWWEIYQDETSELVATHWPAVERVAGALVECGRLDGEALRAAIGGAA